MGFFPSEDSLRATEAGSDSGEAILAARSASSVSELSRQQAVPKMFHGGDQHTGVK